MKKRVPGNFVLISIMTTLILFACKKDSKETSPNDQTNISTHADDQSRVDNEIDAIANDADIALEATSSFSGRFESVFGIICDANVVANADSDPMTITITYDGTSCHGNRTRTGVVKLSMAKGTKWKTAGAIITVSVEQLKVTRLIDNKSVTINGTQTFTNVSGGLLANVSAQSVVHTINSSGLSITFDDGTQRSWQVAKQRTFSYSNGLVITTIGTHTEGQASGIAEWGTNRFGSNFTTSITSPIVVRQDCSFRLTSGATKLVIPLVTASATFGLDITGAPVACPTGNYFYKLAWTGLGGNSYTLVLPY